jgi:hypothetical protein
MGFCSLDDIRSLLMLAITAADETSACQRAIDEATESIRNYCHQHIAQVVDDKLIIDVLHGTRTKIFLPELPVVSVKSVIEDGILLTANDDYILGQYGILHRLGRNWTEGIQKLQITYTHGYATIPEDIIGVCVRAAARVYQASLRSKEQDGVMGIASQTLGDYSASFVSEAGGGVGEGVMGVSAARLLLLSEKDILNRYRHWSLQ